MWHLRWREIGKGMLVSGNPTDSHVQSMDSEPHARPLKPEMLKPVQLF